MNDFKKTGVLLLGYGGPHSLEDVKPYLADIFQNKPLHPELIKEITKRYEVIGGLSPLSSIMQMQADALKLHLQYQGLPCKVEIGMRHWTPRILDGMQKLISYGIKNIIAIPIVPYYSYAGTEPYIELVKTGCGKINETSCHEITYKFVRDWHLSPCLIEAFASRITEAFNNHKKDLSADEKGLPFVFFTAHSLPLTQFNDNKDYIGEIKETADAIAKRLNILNWAVAFQSKGRSGNNSERWLGPSVEEKLKEVKNAGVTRVLLVPVGFLCDNVEILYDIDIVFRSIAYDMGVALFRTKSLNTHTLLISALADIVKNLAAEKMVKNG